MADFLTIPYASPLGWIIQTGAGTINNGVVFFRNEIYPKNGAEACGEAYPPFCQPMDCSEALTIQINANLDADGGSIFQLEIYDINGDFISDDLFAIVSGQTTVQEAIADFSTLDCPGCYYLVIKSFAFLDESNLWTCGNLGLFEPPLATWGVTSGLLNTVSIDLVNFKQGTASAKITATAGVPAGDSYRIIYCGSILFAAETTYQVSGWVREDSGAPWNSGAFDMVYWNLQSGLTDATIISETKFDPNVDGYDTWVKISIVFKTGTMDLSGIWEIRSTSVPAATGIMNVDWIIVQDGTATEEARSQWICADNLDECYKRVVYYNNDNSSGMVYDQDLQNVVYVKSVYANDRFEDPLFRDNRTSDGSTDIIKSQLARIVSLHIDLMPAYMHQIISAAMKHDNFLIDGYGWHPLDPAYQPEYPEKTQVGTAETELIDPTFNVDNTYC